MFFRQINELKDFIEKNQEEVYMGLDIIGIEVEPKLLNSKEPGPYFVTLVYANDPVTVHPQTMGDYTFIYMTREEADSKPYGDYVDVTWFH